MTIQAGQIRPVFIPLRASVRAHEAGEAAWPKPGFGRCAGGAF